MRRRVAAALTSVLATLTLTCSVATALDVELRDYAPDRVERQRAYTRGEMPLPTTPNLAKLDDRLAGRGLAKGRPIFIRVFKASSELEIWMQKGDRFELLDIYPVCHWTGTLGPKLKEGDRQSPEGFYSVANRQMRLVGRWQKAFNLGYPNHHDQMNKRTGSFILVHGGCSSVGCFAMTEQVQDEIFALADAAVKGGQQRFHVQVFPFRMTEQSMELFKDHQWASFWQELKAGYDSFERTRVPPKVGLCGDRYHITDGIPGDVGESNSLVQLPRNGGTCGPTEAKASKQAETATPMSTLTPASKTVAKQSVASSKVDDSDEDERPARKKLQPRAQATSARSSVGAKRATNAASPAAAASANGPDIPNGFAVDSKKGGVRSVLSGG